MSPKSENFSREVIFSRPNVFKLVPEYQFRYFVLTLPSPAGAYLSIHAVTPIISANRVILIDESYVCSLRNNFYISFISVYAT